MSEYVAGAWNAVCDRCGFEYKSRQLSKEWTGLRTCRGPNTNDCWEPRHPQETLRAKPDRQAVPWTRPEGPDVFLSPGDVTVEDL